MKRILSCLLTLILLLGCAAHASEPFDRLHVVGCEEYVTLREEPSTGAKRLYQIPLGALVTYYEDAENGFAKVHYSGCIGYVLSQYLSRLDPQTGNDYFVPMYVANCNKYISQRSEPNTSASVKQRIPLGAQVESYGRTDGFDPSDANASMEQLGYLGKKGYLYGYALSRYLCFLPPDTDRCALISATMRVNDEDGFLRQQTVTDPALLRELEDIIRRAEPSEEGKCPLNVQLELKLTQGGALYLGLPGDGCTWFIAENLSVYGLTRQDCNRLWEIFGYESAGIY